MPKQIQRGERAQGLTFKTDPFLKPQVKSEALSDLGKKCSFHGSSMVLHLWKYANLRRMRLKEQVGRGSS